MWQEGSCRSINGVNPCMCASAQLIKLIRQVVRALQALGVQFWDRAALKHSTVSVFASIIGQRMHFKFAIANQLHPHLTRHFFNLAEVATCHLEEHCKSTGSALGNFQPKVDCNNKYDNLTELSSGTGSSGSNFEVILIKGKLTIMMIESSHKCSNIVKKRQAFAVTFPKMEYGQKSPCP